MRPLLLIGCVALLPAFAQAQLNPTVKLLPRPSAPVPAECDQSVAPQPPPPRITTEEKTITRDTTADMQAPPSATLRSELRHAVEAAQANDRDTFVEALGRAKSMMANYPSGAERNAANDLVNVLSDVDAIWNFQFTSPTGAFFDAGSDVFKIANRYPGWDAYVRRQVITDATGAKFYPTRETRDVVLNEAASRLSRLTGQPVARVAPPARRTPAISTETQPAKPRAKPATTTVASKPTTKPSVKRTERASVTRTHRRSAHVTKKAPVQTAMKTQAPAPTRRTEVAKSVPAARATPAPSPKRTSPGSMSNTTAPAPTTRRAASSTTPPASTSKPPASTTELPPATASTATEATAPTDTMVAPSTTQPQTTTSTAETSTSNQPKPKSQRSFFWPIVLIVAGLCALVLLLRASS